MSLADVLAVIPIVRDIVSAIERRLGGPEIDISPMEPAFLWRGGTYVNFVPEEIHLWIRLFVTNGPSRPGILETLIARFESASPIAFNPMGLKREIKRYPDWFTYPLIMDKEETISAYFHFQGAVDYASAEEFADVLKYLDDFEVNFEYQTSANGGRKRKKKTLRLSGDFQGYKDGIFQFWAKDSERPDLVQRATDP